MAEDAAEGGLGCHRRTARHRHLSKLTGVLVFAATSSAKVKHASLKLSGVS